MSEAPDALLLALALKPVVLSADVRSSQCAEQKKKSGDCAKKNRAVRWLVRSTRFVTPSKNEGFILVDKIILSVNYTVC